MSKQYVIMQFMVEEGITGLLGPIVYPSKQAAINAAKEYAEEVAEECRVDGNPAEVATELFNEPQEDASVAQVRVLIEGDLEYEFTIIMLEPPAQ